MRYGALRPPIRNQSRRRPGKKFVPERLSKFAQHSGCRRRRNAERICGRREIAGFAERAEKNEQIAVERFGHGNLPLLLTFRVLQRLDQATFSENLANNRMQ